MLMMHFSLPRLAVTLVNVKAVDSTQFKSTQKGQVTVLNCLQAPFQLGHPETGIPEGSRMDCSSSPCPVRPWAADARLNTRNNDRAEMGPTGMTLNLFCGTVPARG